MSSSSATVRVEKATSDLLVGPDWTLNMDICDSINSDHWQAKDAVKAVKKRLQHKNPKVQFLALTLLETMIKNCGDYVHLQVVEREILQEMIKIVKKKTDMQVRDKILVLLDSWQEAFGGPGGKYPQYYWSYTELKRSGVDFPQRSVDEAPIFTPPVTHPTLRHPPTGYGMPSISSIRLDEAMASEVTNLSISDLDSIRSISDLLSDMLRAVNSNDPGAVKDEVIVDLVSQCRSNKNKLMHLINSTEDEELLGQGLALNDKIQILLAKHDAIASGSPLPTEPSQHLPTAPSESIASLNAPPTARVPANDHFEAEEEEDDEFSQLAHRNSKIQPDPAGTGDQEASPRSNVTVSNTASSTSVSSSSALTNALALSDPPTPVRTATKEQDMIDLLSITLSTNTSPPHTPLTPPTSDQVPLPPNPQGNPYQTQPYPSNQGFTPYNSYVAPWAQQVPPQPVSQPAYQFPQYSSSSSYPPPPWGAPVPTYHNNLASAPNQFQASHTHTAPAAPYMPSPGGNNAPTVIGETNPNSPHPRQAGPSTTHKPYVPPYRLFEDLIDLRHADGGIKTRGTSSSLSSGSSSQSMLGGKK